MDRRPSILSDAVWAVPTALAMALVISVTGVVKFYIDLWLDPRGAVLFERFVIHWYSPFIQEINWLFIRLPGCYFVAILECAIHWSTHTRGDLATGTRPALRKLAVRAAQATAAFFGLSIALSLAFSVPFAIVLSRTAAGWCLALLFALAITTRLRHRFSTGLSTRKVEHTRSVDADHSNRTALRMVAEVGGPRGSPENVAIIAELGNNG